MWCSARCRVEASIERRGNRIVGVQPRIVEVIRERPTPAPAPPPTTPVAPQSPVRRGRASAAEWSQLLEELRRALVTGAVYQRELAELEPALTGVVTAYTRRIRDR